MFSPVDNHPEVYHSTNHGASMGEVEQSRAAVEAQLSALEEQYQSFSINQTTVSVSPDRYERECRTWDESEITVYTRVINDQGDVLQIEETAELPSAQTTAIDTLERTAMNAVTAVADIDCTIETLDEATILGIHNVDEPTSNTLYSLAVVFEAVTAREESSEETTWVESPDSWLSA